MRTPVCKSKARSPVKIVTSSARGPVSQSDVKAPRPNLASFRAVAASIGMKSEVFDAAIDLGQTRRRRASR